MEYFLYRAAWLPKVSPTSWWRFLETFAPVAKIESIRMLLAIAAILDGNPCHWYRFSFHQPWMPEDQTVYLSQPPGYVAEGKETLSENLAKHSMALTICHLWYQKLKAFLSRLVSRHANLIMRFFRSSQSQPPSSISCWYLDSIAIHFLKSPPKISDSQACLHQRLRQFSTSCMNIRNRSPHHIHISSSLHWWGC